MSSKSDIIKFNDNSGLGAAMEKYGRMVEQYLDKYALPSEKNLPNKLHESMRYSIFAGGKRIRPIITLLACEMFGGDPDDALPVAAAVEMIHTYSLIHDDLPAMDNDDLRRGKPTNHKVYGDAMAILAGDALLTMAFGAVALAPKNTSITPHNANLIIETLAAAAGSTGMVGGQAMDIMAAQAAATDKKISEALLYEIHKRKTAAMIAASAKCGAFVANAGIDGVNAMEDFGGALGLLFQISDDIIDHTSTAEQLGKTPGKDKNSNKLTFVSLFGLETARRKMSEIKKRAKSFLEDLRPKSDKLAALTDLVALRDR